MNLQDCVWCFYACSYTHSCCKNTRKRRRKKAPSQENHETLVLILFAQNVSCRALFPFLAFFLHLLLIFFVLCRSHAPRFYSRHFQRPGGHPQPVSEQQHRVAGGVYGVLRHEERHSVRALRTHRHLLPLLATRQEVSHL